ncbi:hypothetical protein Tco_0655209 [Tanacetum coccineum]|uniref:Uncharacterized protein n=1 Tax=Tanacetum coccineum TaxID=301880 RepID=A0ABQ4X609_9ASTR
MRIRKQTCYDQTEASAFSGAKPNRNTTDHSVVVSDSSATDYDLADDLLWLLSTTSFIGEADWINSLRRRIKTRNPQHVTQRLVVFNCDTRFAGGELVAARAANCWGTRLPKTPGLPEAAGHRVPACGELEPGAGPPGGRTGIGPKAGS